jgi:DNA gyrase subunit A
LVNLLNLNDGQSITQIMPLPENTDEWDNLNIFFATKMGNVRRNDLEDFKRIQTNGKIAIRLEDEDRLIGVSVCNNDSHIMLATRLGKAIRFPIDAVRVFKSRTSDGVRGIKIGSNDEVISMTVLRGAEFDIADRDAYLRIPLLDRSDVSTKSDEELKDFGVDISLLRSMSEQEEFIMTVSSNGFGKISSAYEYRITDRGGSGVVNIVINEKIGHVVASLPVSKSDDIMLITNTGKLIRCPLSSVRVTGRSTSGVILFKTAADEHVVSVALIASDASSDAADDTSNVDESCY